MRTRRDDWLLTVFVLLSLLLHVAVASRLSLRFLLEAPEPQPEPIVVEVLPPEKKERELDLPKTPPETRKTPAKRLAEQDHTAKKETAPKGQDFEDRTAPRKPSLPVRPLLTPPRRAPVPPRPERPQATPHAGTVPVAPRPKAGVPGIPLDSLLKLPQATLDREARRKERDGVAEGDVVWLDTEKDILASFFRRFRDNIYMAWIYPAASVHRGEQGACRLQVVVDRQGIVKKVDVLRESGFPALDRAAVAAVRKGSPYGPLHSSYKGQTLQIVADFHYVLGRDKPMIRRWGYRQI